METLGCQGRAEAQRGGVRRAVSLVARETPRELGGA